MTLSSRTELARFDSRGRRPGGRDRRYGAAVLGGAIALGIALAGCAGPAQVADPAPDASRTPTAAPASSTPTVTTAPPMSPPASQVLGEGVRPASVRIPSIDLDEPLIDLGIMADGTMGVPNDWGAVGWFTGGGKPGGRGPTVIAGHVDSVSAPAVFFRLDELVPGDSVEVVDVDGAVVTYTVSEVADYPKAEFPTARVFGAIPGDELRLITCGGYFDPAAASYEDNRVVFAVRT